MPNTTPKRNTARRRAAAVLSALFVLLALTAGVTFARYATGKQAEGTVSSPDFYFGSDLLFTLPETYTLNPGQSGTTSFSFEVRNWVDALRINEKNIGVTVTVLPSDGIHINGIETAEATLTLAGNSKNSATVTVAGLKNGQTYTISATGEAGFKSTLTATVTVKPDEPHIFMHLNDADNYYVLLTVWTKNLSGEVTVTYPADLTPDATDPVMTGKAAGTPITDNTNFQTAYSTHVYRFFKNTPGKNYTDSGFAAGIDHDNSDSTLDIPAISATPQ